MEEKFLKSIKNIYKNPMANIKRDGEKLEVFPLTTPLNILLEVLASAITQEKEINYTDWEGRNNTVCR